MLLISYDTSYNIIWVNYFIFIENIQEETNIWWKIWIREEYEVKDEKQGRKVVFPNVGQNIKCYRDR